MRPVVGRGLALFVFFFFKKNVRPSFPPSLFSLSFSLLEKNRRKMT